MFFIDVVDFPLNRIDDVVKSFRACGPWLHTQTYRNLSCVINIVNPYKALVSIATRDSSMVTRVFCRLIAFSFDFFRTIIKYYAFSWSLVNVDFDHLLQTSISNSWVTIRIIGILIMNILHSVSLLLNSYHHYIIAS
jgi:hypothetical protein